MHIVRGSKLAIHANKITDALFEHIERAAAQGTPFPVVKLTQEFTGLRAVKERSPETLAVARAVAPHDGMQGIENITDAEVEAWSDEVLKPLHDFAAHNDGWEEYIDVWEVINEADPVGDRGYLMLGKVMRRCVQKANAAYPGVSWGVGSMNMGTPEYSEMRAFVDSGVFEEANVVLCLHEGVPKPGDPINKWHSTEDDDKPPEEQNEDTGLIPGAPSVPEGGGALFGRVAYWHQILGDESMPFVIITEAYLHAYGDTEQIRVRASWVDTLYAGMWYVVAWCPFTHSPTPRWDDQDYTPAYPALMQYMATVKGRQNAPRPQPEPEPEPQPEPDSVRAWVWEQSQQRDTTNHDAALQKAILGREPWKLYGTEFWREHSNGELYALQSAIRWDTEERAVAYARVPVWHDVQFIAGPEEEAGASVDLAVPYLSQWTPTADRSSGDCGPATVAMIANYHGRAVTVNDAAAACGQAPGSDSASIGQLRRGLDVYGVANTYRRPMTLDALRAELNAGHPVILLIHYGSLTGNQDTFRGGHFFVAVGYGEDEDGPYFLVNDSNWWGSRIQEGDHRRIPAEMLARAWEEASLDGNYARQGIVALGVGSEPEPPPTPTIDLLPYLRGDGRLYEVRNAAGGQERFQTQRDGRIFYQTKNAAWEMLVFDDNTIYRDVDTSPGGGRYYRLLEGGTPGSRWIPRHWRVGLSYSRSRRVQFYRKSDCARLPENSGDVTDTMRFIAHHDSYTFRTGIRVNDVVELEWTNGGERYFYGRGFGLVAWERLHQDPNTPQWSAISEIHQPGQRPDNVRERIECLEV